MAAEGAARGLERKIGDDEEAFGSGEPRSAPRMAEASKRQTGYQILSFRAELDF